VLAKTKNSTYRAMTINAIRGLAYVVDVSTQLSHYALNK